MRELKKFRPQVRRKQFQNIKKKKKTSTKNKMFRAYNNFISRSPLLGKALTAGVLVGTGDVIAQLFFDKKENKGGLCCGENEIFRIE